jgi:hypothetical protein
MQVPPSAIRAGAPGGFQLGGGPVGLYIGPGAFGPGPAALGPLVQQKPLSAAPPNWAEHVPSDCQH